LRCPIAASFVWINCEESIEFKLKKHRQNRDLGREVAYRAARLIAEEGVTDFVTAKEKAARQIGVTD
jgi:hypothetical protein